MVKSSESISDRLSVAEIRRRSAQLGETENWDERVALWRAGLDPTESANRCGDWFTVRFNLAVTLMDPPAELLGKSVEEAIGLLDSIASSVPAERCPHEYGITHLALGRALAKRTKGSRYENMAEATRHYRKALSYYEGQGDTVRVAEIVASIGHALVEGVLGSRGADALTVLELRRRHYQEALRCYEAALETFTEEEFEQEFRELTRKIRALEEFLEQIDRSLGRRQTPE